jgi:hypothetical protein
MYSRDVLLKYVGGGVHVCVMGEGIWDIGNQTETKDPVNNLYTVHNLVKAQP